MSRFRKLLSSVIGGAAVASAVIVEFVEPLQEVLPPKARGAVVAVSAVLAWLARAPLPVKTTQDQK